tara:strand:- start:322 stop:540 length:219 start_codon:yes stop_codon:yes gene_type:complete
VIIPLEIPPPEKAKIKETKEIKCPIKPIPSGPRFEALTFIKTKEDNNLEKLAAEIKRNFVVTIYLSIFSRYE